MHRSSTSQVLISAKLHSHLHLKWIAETTFKRNHFKVRLQNYEAKVRQGMPKINTTRIAKKMAFK